MNKKIIIPSILGTLVVICLIYNFLSYGGGTVYLKFETPNMKKNVPNNIELKVYMENSGSMNGYMCNGSNLKDAVYDYVSDLKKQSDTCSLYYINSQMIPCKTSLDLYIKNLTPESFAKAGGNTMNTDLREMFKMILANHNDNTISVFVSDCILDIPQNAAFYFGNCQVSIKNTFSEALANYPSLGVQISKLQSKFEGYWFCGKNKALLKDAMRPYYIWVIGNKNVLAKMRAKTPIENIIGGIQEYCAYSTSEAIPFNIDRKRYAINHNGIISVEILADLSSSLQNDKTISSWDLYTLPNQMTLTSILPITAEDRKFSHVINVDIANPKNLSMATITYTYPYLPKWVEDSNDDTGQNVQVNLDKTTGILYLVKGVAEAYKQHNNYGSITFEIKNR